jgi:hypothetical protein
MRLISVPLFVLLAHAAMAREQPAADPHTLSNYLQAYISHVDLRLRIDFNARIFYGLATLEVHLSGSDIKLNRMLRGFTG